jgi:hypothetical protein
MTFLVGRTTPGVRRIGDTVHLRPGVRGATMQETRTLQSAEDLFRDVGS